MIKGKKIVTLMISTIFVVNFVPTYNVFATDLGNLIKNNGFEENFYDWNVWKDKGDFTAVIDNSISNEGVNSLKINASSENSRGTVAQTVVIPEELKGGIIGISQYVKSENLIGNAIMVRVRFLNNSGQEICDREYYPLEVGKNDDWKETQVNLEVHEDVSSLYVEYIYDECYGTVWIDNVEAKKILNIDEMNLIKNGDFEATLKQTPIEWAIQGLGDTVDCTYDFQDKYSGSNSLKISSKTSNGNIRMTQTIPYIDAVRDNTIVLSQAFKGDSSNLYINIKYRDKDGNVVKEEYNKSHVVKVSGEWNTYAYKTSVPDDDRISNILIEYQTYNIEQNLWLDDIKLTPYVQTDWIDVNPSIVKLQKDERINLNLDSIVKNGINSEYILTSSDEDVVRIENETEAVGVDEGFANIIVTDKNKTFRREIPVWIGYNENIIVENNTLLNVVQGKEVSGKINVATDNSLLKFNIFSNSNYGYVKLNRNGEFTYYSNSEYIGQDSFTVKIADGFGNERLEQYKVQVGKDLSKKLVDDFNIITEEGKEIAGQVSIGNKAVSALQIDTGAKNGSITINNDGTYKYTPNSGFYGYDFATVNVSGRNGESSSVNVKIFVAPSADTIYSRQNNSKLKTLINNEKLQGIKEILNSDESAKKYLAEEKKKMDSLLDKPVINYEVSGTGELNVSSEDYIQQLSIMYALTGEEKYAERALKEIKNVCSYSNWNTNHFLDTARLSSAVAIGYDLLSDYLSDSDKSYIKESIINKALKPANEIYNSNSGYTIQESNWNIVCNSGIIVSSLVLMDDSNYEFTSKLVSNAFKSLALSLNSYYEDGSTYEGPTYWILATDYLVRLVSSLNNSLDMGNIFDENIDYSKLADFPLNIAGGTGAFNYTDAGTGYIPSYFNLWIADKTNDINDAYYSKLCYEKNREISVYDLLWFNPEILKLKYTAELDKYFDSNEIVTMRSSYTNSSSSFVAFKGGTTDLNHGDLDIGSFIFDSLGIRWAVDLGSENYGNSGYWDMGTSGRRWQYYKKRAEGHNTLVIDNEDNTDQVIGSESTIIESNLNTDNPYSILDMTNAYSDTAIKVLRKVELIDSRKNLVIEDSFLLKEAKDVAWQMHTKADVEVSNDNKVITLRQSDKVLRLLVESDCDIKVNVTKTSEYKKISINTNTISGKIKVTLAPEGDINSYSIVKNGEFNEEMASWSVWDEYNNLDVSIENSNYNNYIKIASMDGEKARGILNQELDISNYNGSAIKLSQSLKSEGLIGNVDLRYSFYDKDGEIIGEKKEVNLLSSDTSEWTEIDVDILVEESAATMLIEYVYDDCLGIVWIDKVTEKYLKGDVNFDCSVDLLDLALISQQFNKSVDKNGIDKKYDLNEDNIVDIFDLSIMNGLIY